MNEIIADEKDTNNEIFLNYFKYQNPSFLVNDLISAKQNKNEKLVNNANKGLIDLRNDMNRKKIPENENPKKVADNLKKILDFNTQDKRLPRKLPSRPSDLAKQLKIFTPKQMFQRSPIALSQVKSGNAYENLLNEIRQIMYSLYREKKVTKKVCNNIINSIKL